MTREVGTTTWRSVLLATALALVALATATPGAALAQDATELAKKTQNPVSDLISVPFQHNFNFTVGPGDDLQYVLNIQPVVPFRLTEDWNLISRTIIPLIYQPELAPGVGDVFGIGDIQLSLFLSPAKPGALIWGIGPILQRATASDPSLGTDTWAMGPTAVALSVQGRWVVGGLINHLWSLESRTDVQVGRYYNVVRPDDGPEWNLRLQVQLLFPR